MNPASTIKLLTTLFALEQLGSDYRFKTKLYLKGSIQSGVLEGQLFIKGFGDPKLIPETLLQLVEQLKNMVSITINAQIILDTSAYQSSVKDSAPNDGEETKPYNV
jgi:D-alanyl-D-alanine carboxypeptidase/D-alanyl-D-alanine-endopeptidase (penicillin-binding protein 4)